MDVGFLTDRDIIKKGQELLGDQFNQEHARRASYDLSLGEEVYISGKEYPKLLSATDQFVSLPRGQFALLMTREYVKMPKDYLGFISIRVGKKEQGLINVSGFHVDPGFEGKITFSVFNAGPSDVVLEYGEAKFMIFFYKLREPVLRPYDAERQKQKQLQTDVVTSLKGTSASLSDVDRRIRVLEVRDRIFIGLFAALAAGLVALFVQLIVAG